MMPTVLAALFIRFIDGFRVFDNIYVLVGSGPGGATTSMSIYIYETFFRSGEIGQALAAAILLFLTSFLLLAAARLGTPERGVSRLHRQLRWAVFIVAALVMNFPLIAILVTAFKSPAEINRNPSLWVESPTLENFRTVLTVSDRLNIYHYLWNSTAAATIGAVLPILVCFPIAWAMARRGVGRAMLMPLVVNLRALPLIVFAIPLYLMYRATGLLDTRLGLGLILAVVNLPLTLLLLVNAIADLPAELEEAALVDGAGLPMTLRRVILPLLRPVLVTVFIFGFITAWNEFLFGLMLTTREAVPVVVGASFFFASSGGGVQWGVAAAVMLIAALPPVVLGLVMYRRLQGSLLSGAIKG